MFSYILAYRDNGVNKKDHIVGNVFVSRGLEIFFAPNTSNHFHVLSKHTHLDNAGQEIYVIENNTIRLAFNNSTLEVFLNLEEKYKGSFVSRLQLTTNSKGFWLIAEVNVDEKIKQLIDARYKPVAYEEEEQTKLNILCVHYTDQIARLIENSTPDSIEPYCGLSHLKFMLDTIRNDPNQSLTKKHRWLGYVQAILITQYHAATVDGERDFTRGIFNGS